MNRADVLPWGRAEGWYVFSDRRRSSNPDAQQRRFAALVDLAPDIIYQLDRDGRIVFINEAVRKLGYLPKTLVGKQFLELVHPEDRDRAASRIMEKRTGLRATSGLDVRLIARGGQVLDYDVQTCCVEINATGVWSVPNEEIQRTDKVFLYTQGIARDVTQRKRYEQELAQWAAFVRNNPAPVLQLDPAGRILLANPIAQELLGSDFVSRPVGEVLSEATDGALQQVRPRESLIVEQDLGGKLFQFTLYRAAETNIIYVYGSDVTQRVEVEAHLRRQSEELDRFNKTMIGREGRIIELKEEINELCAKLERITLACSVSAVLEEASAVLACDGS